MLGGPLEEERGFRMWVMMVAATVIAVVMQRDLCNRAMKVSAVKFRQQVEPGVIDLNEAKQRQQHPQPPTRRSGPGRPSAATHQIGTCR